MDTDLPVSRLLAGYYRITADRGYANVKRDRETGKWHGDIRNNSGDLVRYAGIWKSKKDAVEEAQFILAREYME
jgi:hypothetical protein